MLDAKKTAIAALANPGKEYKEIKKLSHGALAKGRDFMIADENKKANSSFAFAYQLRCVSDWIFVNMMGNSGDSAHTKFLVLSRNFSKLATGKLTAAQKKSVEGEVARILD